jgi:hypothetical protein
LLVCAAKLLKIHSGQYLDKLSPIDLNKILINKNSYTI